MQTVIDIPRAGPSEPLRARFQGSLLEPGDTGWDAATQAFNPTFVQKPAFVAIPADEQDVATIVDHARERGLQIAAQRAGHNAQPLGDLRDVILLKTDALQGVEIDVDRQIARVRSGAKWETVVPAASKLGLAGLHGSTPDVSVVGYSLGGGVGWYGRKLGLSSNSVTAVELVTADGQLRRVDANHEPDLFWALRGGGGNFGIVTSLELRLYPFANVYAGVLFFPWERSSEVLHAWLEWTRLVPDEVTSVGRILRFPPIDDVPQQLRGQDFVVIEAVVADEDAATGRELIEPMRALGPAIDTFAMVPPQGIAELHMDPTDPTPYVGEGALLGDLPPSAIDALIEAAGPESGSPLVSVELRHTGGALGRSLPHHGALGRLEGSFLTFGLGVVLDEASHDAHRNQLDLIADALRPWDTGRQYLNFTEESTDPARFYTPEAYARLRALRAEHDPDDVFRSNHPIPAAAS